MSDEEFLRIEMRLRRGALALHVCFSLTAGWTCLFGASGSGKTTILRVIAGLERPEDGCVGLGGTVLSDRAAGIFMKPHERPVRMAAQTAWLFRGTVGENLAVGARPGSRAEWLRRTLAMFRLEGFEDRRVEALSGGERQRVSLARAVVAAVYGERPVGLLLLDEPFAGMDAGLRDGLALELRDFLRERGMPVLSVTHDVGEAVLLGCQVIRLVGGRVVDQGAAEVVLAGEIERLKNVLGSCGES